MNICLMLSILGQKGQIRTQTKKKCIHFSFLLTFTTHPSHLQPETLELALLWALTQNFPLAKV